MGVGYRGKTSTIVESINVNATAKFNKEFGLRRQASTYGLYTSFMPSSTAKQRHVGLGAVPKMREWLDERSFGTLAAYEYELLNRKFETGVMISREEIDDDNLGMFMTRVGELGGEVEDFKERFVADLVNQHMAGTVTEFGNGFDGKPLFSTTHTWTKDAYSSNQSNKRSGSSAGKLDLTNGPTNLKASITAMNQFKDGEGRPMGLVPDTLVIAPELIWDVSQILNSPSLLLAAGGDTGTAIVERGSVNPLFGALTVVINRYLLPGHWFIANTRGLNGIIFQERDPVEFAQQTTDASDDVFNRELYKWGVRWRGAVGVGAWFSVVGGDGT